MDLKDQTLTQIHMDLAIGSENTTTWRMDIGILNKKLKKNPYKNYFLMKVGKCFLQYFTMRVKWS